MNMMQFKTDGAFDGADRYASFPGVTGSEFSFGGDVSECDADIVSRQSAINLDLLASTLIAAFRANSHINNVMTHISGARWDLMELALHTILDSSAIPVDLSRLEANIVDLACAERGVTGRIFKPFFETLLARLLSPAPAARLQAHLWSLHGAMENAAAGTRGSTGVAGAGGAVR